MWVFVNKNERERERVREREREEGHRFIIKLSDKERKRVCIC